MKNFLKLSALSIALIGFSSNAMALTANASATVITPIAITQTTALQFGTFSPGTGAGNIDQSGAATGGVISVSSSTKSPGIFAVTGFTGASYTFTLPSTVTISAGGPTMTAALSFASGGASRTLTGGADTVTVNGLLTVGASQANGSYIGTYNVTVNY
jgi:Mat/Ecp fimbriae major subunit